MISTTDLAKTYSFEYGQPLDAKGNNAPIQTGSVKHQSSDESVAVVEGDAEEPFVGHVRLTGKLGVYTITTTADADVTEGERLITGSFNGEVTPSIAVGFGAPRFTEVTEEQGEADATESGKVDVTNGQQQEQTATQDVDAPPADPNIITTESGSYHAGTGELIATDAQPGDAGKSTCP